jgi:hypothetical protein
MLPRAKWRLRKQLPVDSVATIMDAGRARLRAVGEGVKQIAQLAAELRKVESRSPSTRHSPKSAPSHGGGG